MAIYNNFCFSFFADFLYSHIFSHNSGWHIKLYYKEQLTPDWYSTTHAPEISTLTVWYSASHRNDKSDRPTHHPSSFALIVSVCECTTRSRSYFFRYPLEVLTHSLPPSASLAAPFHP